MNEPTTIREYIAARRNEASEKLKRQRKLMNTLNESGLLAILAELDLIEHWLDAHEPLEVKRAEHSCADYIGTDGHCRVCGARYNQAVEPADAHEPKAVGAETKVGDGGLAFLKRPHVGVSSHRLVPAADNPREVAFARQWTKIQDEGRTLEWLIGSDYSERDAEVAATVIQWLGSNIGMSFLEDTIKSEPEIIRWLQMRNAMLAELEKINP